MAKVECKHEGREVAHARVTQHTDRLRQTDVFNLANFQEILRLWKVLGNGRTKQKGKENGTTSGNNCP